MAYGEGDSKSAGKTCRMIWGRCRAGAEALRGLGARWGWLAQMQNILKMLWTTGPKVSMLAKQQKKKEELKKKTSLLLLSPHIRVLDSVAS